MLTVFIFAVSVCTKLQMVMQRQEATVVGTGQSRNISHIAKGSGRLLASQGDSAFTDKNMRFVETKDVDLQRMNYTEPINPFEKNINKISIIFNDGNKRERIDSAMYMPN